MVISEKPNFIVFTQERLTYLIAIISVEEAYIFYQQEWIVIRLYAIAGSFEESVLNGRLEPVSTVHGFTADLGASGSFCPAHLVLPVTVFFYTLGDNDKVSSPYLVSTHIILIFD